MAMVMALSLLFVLLSGHAVACDPLAVKATSIRLDSESPDRTRFGAFTFLKGFKLSSMDARFGGLSGLALHPGGTELYAVSDRGFSLSVRLEHDSEGQLIGFRDWHIAPLQTPEGHVVNLRQRDAEALVRQPDGTFLIAFEGIHRLWHYPNLTAAPQPVSVPAELKGAPQNGGVEAMTRLPDGRLLMLTERYQNPDGSVKGWLIDGGRFAALSYVPSKGFQPTDAAVLKQDVVVLERRYNIFSGASIRIRRIAGSTIQAGARLQGEVILDLESPLRIDNFEGLAVYDTAQLGTWIYLISDDNYNPLQNTLLLQFRLAPTASR